MSDRQPKRTPGSGRPHRQTPVAADADALRAALLAWYDTHQRDLPWRVQARTSPGEPGDGAHASQAREHPTPYYVWVSEIMLQQTQVETVRPYYLRWLERFPTLRALADAPLEDVLALWAGLGYYRRARYLHHAAQIVRDVHGGHLPRDERALRALPGIGRYTAGAIASIAYGVRLPVVDGNVERVLCRLRGIVGDPRQKPVATRLWQEADALVPADRPGDFNQAIMELGALVCTPRRPACDPCPWRPFCVAFRTDRQEALPTPRQRPQRHRIIAAGLVIDAGDGRVVAVRRAADGLLAGLWDTPSVELVRVEGGQRDEGEPPLEPLLDDRTRRRLEAHAREALGVSISSLRPGKPIHHTFTHIDYTVIPWHCALAAPAPLAVADARYAEARCVTESELLALGTSALTRKLLASR